MRQMLYIAIAGKPDGIGWWIAGCMSLMLLAVCAVAVPVQWLLKKGRR